MEPCCLLPSRLLQVPLLCAAIRGGKQEKGSIWTKLLRGQSPCRQPPHHAVSRHLLDDNILATVLPHGTSREVAIERDIVCEIPTAHRPNIHQRHARDGFIAQICSRAYLCCLL